MKKWPKRLFVGYIGDDISYPVIFREYLISHEIRIPEPEPTSVMEYHQGFDQLLTCFNLFS